MADLPTSSAGVNQRRIVFSLLWIFGAVMFALTVALALIASLGGPVSPARHPTPTLPPRLEAQPTMDLAHYKAAQDARLSRYGWIDQRAGVIQIPIERAMKILATRGPPAADATP